ncbi:MAG: hypothetical protein P8Y93_13700 [Acidobacteriota bacterium]
MLTREQKKQQSEELRSVLSDVVRKTEGTYRVAKNTVVRLAVEGTEMEGITPFLT